MDDTFTTQKLLVLRRLTRAVGDVLRTHLKDYLIALTPLLRPRTIFGELVTGGPKETISGADKAFKELQTAFEAVATSKLYNLPKELKSPVEVTSATLEFVPVEYSHSAKTERETKTVTVTSPLKWVLCYSGFNPRRLRDLLAAKTRNDDDVREFLVHTLLLQVVLARQAGVTKILEALHFKISTDKRPEFGELPLTYVASEVSTMLPPDAVVIESTEIAGMDVFEEVVNMDDIVRLSDRLRGQLLELVKKHAEGLLPAQGGG